MYKQCNIVIVDDELLIRQGIINYMDWEAEGFKIVGAAANGQEALQMIEQLHPHVMITDVVMPIMDGIELVKVVKEQFPHIEIVVLSSFEDYEYVRSTFQSGVADYILKHQLNGEKLLKTLRQIVAKIPDLRNPELPSERAVSVAGIVESMMLGTQSDVDEQMVSTHFPHKYYVLLALYCKNNAIHLNKLNLIVEQLQDKLNDSAFQVVLQEEAGLIILINFRAGNFTQVKLAIQEVAETKVVARAHVQFILTEPFVSINAIKTIYHDDLLKMKQYAFYFPNDALLARDLLPRRKKQKSRFDLNYFIKIFKERQFEAALNYVNEHISDLSTDYTRDSFEFKSFVGNIMFNIIVLMENLQLHVKDLEKKKYRFFSDVNDAPHVNEVKAVYEVFLNEVKRIIFADDVAAGPADLQTMLNYIEEHYSEPLTLSKVARHFHFNPSYLSFYFNTKHHEGFSEYLNRIRIKKAMELLTNSQMSISDISGMVGYSGHSYFCKVFKKMTGVSPSKYRKAYRGMK